MDSNQESVDINNNELKNQNNNSISYSDKEITEENCRFTDGQILKFIRVRFPGHAKSYPFIVGKRKLMYGQKVMAMSDRGMAVGYINSFPYDTPFKKDMLPIRSIAKIASDEDMSNEKDTYKKQKDTETLCQRLIEKHNLDMNLTHVEFTGYGKKVVFYFIAPARVDFRNLVKDLVTELKLRIELRQISVRDRAASMGALGPCGRELCCSSFLTRYGNVSVKMAKNQNLTLNYSKLNGVCGQLKCCLQYEDEVYANKRKKMPDEGQYVSTKDGQMGKVTRIHILSEQFDVLTNRGQVKRYVSSMLDKKISEVDAKMPRRFDNISDETSTIVGLTEEEANQAKIYKEEIDKLTQNSKEFAFDTYYELTGLDKPEFIQEEVKEVPVVEDKIIQFKANPDPQPVIEDYVEEKQGEEIKEKIENSESEEGKAPKKNNYRKNNNRNRNKNRNKNKAKSNDNAKPSSGDKN